MYVRKNQEGKYGKPALILFNKRPKQIHIAEANCIIHTFEYMLSKYRSFKNWKKAKISAFRGKVLYREEIVQFSKDISQPRERDQIWYRLGRQENTEQVKNANVIWRIYSKEQG